MPRPRRIFTAEFKDQLVLQLIPGDVSQAELCRKHKLAPQLESHRSPKPDHTF